MEVASDGTFDRFDRLTAGKLTAGKAELWRQRIEAQHASGQSVRQWCSANGVREQSFYGWRRRLNPSNPANLSPSFARVVLDASGHEPLRLRFRGERELILPATMPMSGVAELVIALERLS